MKLIIAAFAALFPMSAMADATFFAANGCDVLTLVPVMSEAGEVLYWTNTNGGGCQADRGDTGAAIKAMSEAERIAREKLVIAEK